MALSWEDREVRFDVPYNEMRLKLGEKVIDRLENIEDTKGNGGGRGRMIITNIRIIWHSVPSPRINLSIGLNCITSINIKIVNSKLKGTTQALNILTLSNTNRFEFIFTNLIPGNYRHFTSVTGVHRAFVASKLYRELKLRSAIVSQNQLKILPTEQIFSTLYGVWNLSSDQGSLGTFIVTNIRIVWFADINEAFNISLPYLQISTIKIRDSKFGTALVITSSEISGAYILGFRIDSEEKLDNLYKELTSLYAIYSKNPILGIDYKATNKQGQNDNIIENFEEVSESKDEISNTITAYLADGENVKDKPPVYSPELGLAIEKIKEGYTLQKLWEVIPPQ